MASSRWAKNRCYLLSNAHKSKASTFNFCVRCFLRVSDIHHQETLGSLIEAHYELLKLGFLRDDSETPERIHQPTLVEENIDPELIVIGSEVG